MICPNCGHTNPDTNSWCSACGSDLRAAQPAAIAPMAAATPLTPGSAGRLALKKVATSPVFLIAAIFTALTPIFSLLFTATGGHLDTIRSLLEMLRSAGLGDMVNEIEPTLNQSLGSSSLISQLSGSLPSVLTILALFLIYGTARSSDGTRPMSTAGLTILQVLIIISLVSVCLAALLVLIVSLVLMVAAANVSGEAGSVAMTVALVFFVVMAAVITFAIIYYAHVLRSIRAAKDVCEQGYTHRKPSMFVAVIGFIGGGGNVVSGLSGVLSVMLAPAMIFNVLSVLASAASLILFSISLIQFRSALADLPQPLLPASPYAPYPTSPYAGGYLPPQQPQWQPPQQPQWQPSQQSQWHSTTPNNDQ